MERFIGTIIDYDPQPYGPRKVRITAITQTGTRQVCERDAEGNYTFPQVPCYRAEGVVTEGVEISRLFQHVSCKSIAGRKETLYGMTERDLIAGHYTTALCG